MASIAVLITYHEERELLSENLASLHAQTRPPDEILIYDDASTAPAADYLPSGLPVRVLRGETNQGPGAGRNALLAASTSDYVHFHDADDLFLADWCQRVSDALDTTAPDIVFTEIMSSRDGVTVSGRVLELERLRADPDLLRFCLRYAMLTPSGTHRRGAIEAVGGFRAGLWQSEDFDFHIRLAASRPRYELVLEPLVHIRLRGESRSQQQVEVWTSALQAIEALAYELPADYRDELADAAARTGSVLFKLGAMSEARRAFGVASRVGRPSFQHKRGVHRVMARRLGPMLAERLAAGYQDVLPEPLRRLVGVRQ
jgi:glycosyltransferase involved in cell wall biosynthesis